MRQAVEKNGVNADNTTALALRWHDERDPDPVPMLSSLGLPDGAVTTTIAIGQATEREAPDSDDLSEDEIEKTIAEIQEAIQRSNKPA